MKENRYFINYNTGVGNEYADTLEEAKEKAENGMCYTQREGAVYMLKKTCEHCGRLRSMMSWEKFCWECQKEIELERQQAAIRGENDDDIDTYSTDYVICPYCGNAFEPHTVDNAECYEQCEQEMKCAECGKIFKLYTEVSYSWETEKID